MLSVHTRASQCVVAQYRLLSFVFVPGMSMLVGVAGWELNGGDALKQAALTWIDPVSLEMRLASDGESEAKRQIEPSEWQVDGLSTFNPNSENYYAVCYKAAQLQALAVFRRDHTKPRVIEIDNAQCGNEIIRGLQYDTQQQRLLAVTAVNTDKAKAFLTELIVHDDDCLLYTSPSPRDRG